MNERTVKHDSFSIERHYSASVSTVFEAWANPAIKAEWFPKAEEFDFRIGGRELLRVAAPDGQIFTSVATFQEIVPEARIVYSFTLDMGETRISVSLMTVEFRVEDEGTHLIYTEQCAFFDDLDSLENHRHGANEFMKKLDFVLQNTNEETIGGI